MVAHKHNDRTSEMKLVFENGRYICRCSYNERQWPKKVGFRWDLLYKVWYTRDPRVASRLREYAEGIAKNKIDSNLISITPWTGAIPYPKDLTPLPFQIEAVKFALSRNKSYLALDPGLGKTIIAQLILNSLKVPCLYVCPPFLRKNVESELTKWAVDYDVEKKVVLFKDSMFTVPSAVDAVIRTVEKIKLKPILIIDEAHRFKTDKAKRTRALFDAVFPYFERVVFLSGTPMPNRPIELYTILSSAAPEVIDYASKHVYGLQYCGAYRGTWGWDYSGASNMERLEAKVKDKFMLRVRKSEVLKELPSKIEEMVILEDAMPARLSKLDQRLLKTYSPEDLMKSEIGVEHVSTYRKELGIQKAQSATTFLKELLENSDEKILVFAIHKEVILRLSMYLEDFKPLVISGSVPSEKRQEIVDRFQAYPNERVLILNIQAGGVGFNLTKATRVVFVEYSWVPAENDQASDRVHRIGLENSVFVQFLVYKNSIDRQVLETLFRKKKITNHV